MHTLIVGFGYSCSGLGGLVLSILATVGDRKDVVFATNLERCLMGIADDGRKPGRGMGGIWGCGDEWI